VLEDDPPLPEFVLEGDEADELPVDDVRVAMLIVALRAMELPVPALAAAVVVVLVAATVVVFEEVELEELPPTIGVEPEEAVAEVEAVAEAAEEEPEEEEPEEEEPPVREKRPV